MRITFLGSGGAFTDYRVNYQNNALVETSEGPVLIDCGTTAVQSLKELGVHPTEVRAVALTHLHADHASPEQLVWERYYGGKEGRPSFLSTTLLGPADLLDPLQRSLDPFLGIFSDRKGQIRVDGLEHLLEPQVVREVQIGELRIRWFRVPHVVGPSIDKPAYGLDLDDGKVRVLWSGDTTFAPRWIRDAAEDPRVARIFHECLFLPRFGGTVHTHFEELAGLPEDIQQRLTLMHHTRVPDGLDLGALRGAALRHEVFDL